MDDSLCSLVGDLLRRDGDEKGSGLRHGGSAVLPIDHCLIAAEDPGLIERFWTTEEEDGTGPAVRTMAATLLTSAAVIAVTRLDWVRLTMTTHPEALGLVVAGQLLLGRYTGDRLTELTRFRGLAQ